MNAYRLLATLALTFIVCVPLQGQPRASTGYGVESANDEYARQQADYNRQWNGDSNASSESSYFEPSFEPKFDSRPNQQSQQPAVTSRHVPTRMTRQRDFGIPFKLTANNAAAAEVHLYVSSDQGRDWKLYQRLNANSKAFQFRAPNDGEYWFSVRTVDRRGQPISVATNQPELKVVVDTQLPRMNLRVSQDHQGQATAEWIAEDPNLAAHTFQLQYRELGGQWQNADIVTPAQDEWQQEWRDYVQWPIGAADRGMEVRAEILDRAGNATLVTKRIAASGQAAQQFASQGLRDRNSMSSDFREVSVQRDGVGSAESFGNSRADLPEWLSRTPSDRNGQSTGYGFGSGQGQPVGSQSGVGGTDYSRGNMGYDPYDHGPTHSDIRSPVANQFPGQSQNEPEPRITSSPNFALEYDVFNVGTKGPRLVELWVTMDRGATWEMLQADADKQSPIEVQLSQEGYYGFRLVVHGYDAPAPRAPQNGQVADLSVVVDWTKPQARLTRAYYDERLGAIQIEWMADDRLLSEKPITLSYSESPQGPWTPFASNVPDSGTYSWRLQRRPPGRLYLQMEVSDLAGNISSSVFDIAAGYELKAGQDGRYAGAAESPTGRIRDVRPLGRDQRRY